MRSLLVTLALFVTTLCFAQHPGLKIQQPVGPKPWTNLDINDKPGQFQFVVVTDRTGGHRPGVFEKGVEKINLLQPEFVMSVGDLIEGYSTDTIDINRQWDEFCGFVEKLEMPFFFVPGNHDLANPVMEQVWKKRFGTTHYYFVYKDVLFMALNSEDQTRGSGRGSISEPQLEWIRATLEAHPDVKWTFLFLHQPLWRQQVDPVKWSDVEKLLANRKHTVFAGHHHRYQRFERNNSQYYMLATTGGASPLQGPKLGEFDHFVWVTMTDQGPVLANLHLDGVFDHDVFNDELAALTQRIRSSAPVQLVAPLFMENGSFRRDSIQFRVTNPFDVPIKVKLTHSFSWDYKADIATPELTIPPNSVEFVAMELIARKQKAPEHLRAIKVKAEVAIQDGGKHDFFVPFEFNVAPLPKYQLERTSRPIKIDGVLNDWTSLPNTLSLPEGGRFGIVSDDKFIYLGVQVNDSEIMNNASGTPTRQDYVAFVLDAQPLAKSAAEKGNARYENSLHFIVSPEEKRGKIAVMYLDDHEKQLAWKCIRNKEGYAFEIAIPISYIQSKQGEHWRHFRLNVMAQDKDPEKTSLPDRASWHPIWTDRDHVPGSGMFFRNANGKM